MSADHQRNSSTVTESVYYAAVQRIMSQLTPQTLRQFHQLTTDDDRFAFVSALSGVRPALLTASASAATGDTTTESKSNEEASQCRKRGNELYQKERLREALDSYTASVLVAPVTDCGGNTDDDNKVEGCDDEEAEKFNSEFVLALGNRSACLLQMKRYGDCLTDVSAALRYGYPRHLRHKLYDRQARALIELGRFDDALEALRRLQAALSLAQLDQEKRNNIARNAEKKMDFCASAVVQPPLPADDNSSTSGNDVAEVTTPPSVSGGKSEMFPGASDAFDVRFHEDRGRYGVAGRDVSVGEVLLVESSYVSVLGAESFTTRCYNCFRWLGDTPYSCHSCSRVRYCSDQCRKQSWELHHKTECRYLGVLLESGTGTMAHLTLKLVAVTGLARLLKCRRNPKSDSEALRQSLFTNTAGVYLGGFVALYGLLSHSEARTPAELFQYTLLAVWLTDILYRTTFARQSAASKDDKEMTMVGGVVLRFLQIVACNGVDVTELGLAETLLRSHPASIGLALYPTVSLLNHSCDPVLELVFYGNACTVRAVQNVSAGGELFIDYGYVYYATGRTDRRAALRRQYFFECQCVACSLDWALKSALPSGAAALKCVNCDAVLGAGDLEAGDTVECSKCRRQQAGLAERLEVLATSQTAAEKAIGDARKFRVSPSTTSALEEHLTIIDKYVQLPWKDYAVCLSTLKQCYRYFGNHRR